MLSLKPSRSTLRSTAAGAVTSAALSAAGFAMAVGLMASTAQAQDLVRVSVWQTTSSLPYFVARERGYFAKQNIKVEAVIAGSTPQIIQGMVTGDVDAASNVLTIECMNINLKRDGVCNLISLNGQNRKFRMEQFMTRPGLEVKSLADFKGKVSKIASAPGPANLAMARAILTKVGLVEGKDYVLTELGMNLHADALRAGTFDAAYTLEPTGTMMANAGAGRLVEAGLISTYLLGRSDAESFMTGAAVTEKFMKERPDVARRFAAALRQANLDVMKDPSTRDLLKGNTFTSADITSTVPLLNFAMVDMIDAQDRKEFQQLIDFTVATKVLSGPIDVSKYLITLDKK